MPRLNGAGRSLAVACGLVNAACLQFRPPPVPVPEEMTGPYHATWTASAGRSASGSLVVVDGTLFLGGTDRTVYAVSADSGAIRWKRRLGGAILAGVTVVDGSVYAGTDRPMGSVVAMDAASGTVRWRSSGRRVGVPLSVAEGLVVLLDREGEIVALEAATGAIRWRRRVGRSLTAPVVLADAVLATTADSIFRLGLHDGAVLARAAGPGELPGGWRRVGTQLAGGTARGEVVTIDPASLAVAWRAGLDAPVLAPLGASGDTLLVVTAAGTVWTVAPGGSARIAFRTGRPATGPPVTDRDGLLLPGADGSLRAYAEDGTERWQINHWRPMTVPPVRLPDGDLVVLGANGDLARYER